MRLIELPNPVNVYGDTSKRSKFYVPEEAAEAITGYARHGARDIYIAAADPPVPVTLNLQDVDDVRGFFFLMDADFDLTINGTGLLSFRRLNTRPENLTEKLRALMQCNTTSLAITNPSTTLPLRGYMLWWGDVA